MAIYHSVQLLTRLWFVLWWCDSFGDVLSATFIDMRKRSFIKLAMDEEMPYNTFVGSLADAIKFPEGQSHVGLRYVLLPSRKSIYFRLDRTSGQLFNTYRLDRDSLCKGTASCCSSSYSLSSDGLVASESPSRDAAACIMDLIVRVEHPNAYIQRFEVLVEIKDVNDNSPTFEKPLLNLTVRENEPTGTLLALPLATDDDSSKFGIQGYYLGTRSQHFGLRFHRDLFEITNLYLVIRKPLDREQTAHHKINVIARDGGGRHGTMTVFLTVSDVNDCVPRFLEDQYKVTIYRWFPTYTRILKVRAKDQDEGENGKLRYELMGDNHVKQLFDVDKHSGDMFLTSHLVTESHQSHNLVVVVRDNGSDVKLSSSVLITIDIKKSDGEQLTISVDALKGGSPLEVPEGEPPGYTIARVTTMSSTSRYGKNIRCNLEPHYGYLSLKKTPDFAFLINTRKVIDREMTERFEIHISCSNYENLSQGAVKKLTIHVLDKNDNSPYFLGKTAFTVSENLNARTFIGTVVAFDKDEGVNGAIAYRLNRAEDRKRFRLSARSGQIFTRQSLDREERSLWILDVVATDLAIENPLSRHANVSIHVLDQNDNMPLFRPNTPTLVNISSNVNTESPFLIINATDADIGPNGRVTFHLDHHFNIFKLTPTGQLFYNPKFAIEETESYRLGILITDNGFPTMSNRMNLSVQIFNINQYRPKFKLNRLFVNLSTCVTNGSSVAKVQATDLDHGLNGAVRYSIIGMNATFLPFSIDARSGDIFLTGPHINHQRSYNIVVEATDRGVPPLSDKLFVIFRFMKKGKNGANYMDIGEEGEGNFMVIIVILLTCFLFFVTFFCIYHVFGAQRREEPEPPNVQFQCSTYV